MRISTALLNLILIACPVTMSTGCMSMFGQKNIPKAAEYDHQGNALPGTPLASDPAQLESLPGTEIETFGAEPEGWGRFTPEAMWNSSRNAVGLGPNRDIAVAAKHEADELFRAAKYKEAAKKYDTAAKRWPDTGLEEESLFWQAESYFFSDQYVKAEDTYDKLIKKYASSRYLDRVVVRQFAIAKYWNQYGDANPQWPVVPNLWDSSRPWFDTAGHALRTYDNVRLNDPRGPLADDAIMAKGNAYFLKHRFEDADHYYELIRKNYPQSEHLLQAYQLGLQSKIRMYQGAGYDGTPLDEANVLLDQMLVQFPNEIGHERERLLTVKKELVAQQAQREFQLAKHYDNGKNYGAARMYYQEVAKNYPNSSFAQQSQERLAQIADEPASPPNRLAWVDHIFDENHRKDMARQERIKNAVQNQSSSESVIK